MIDELSFEKQPIHPTVQKEKSPNTFDLFLSEINTSIADNYPHLTPSEIQDQLNLVRMERKTFTSLHYFKTTPTWKK